MIFYLGHKVDDVIDDKTRLLKNKSKTWKYGYNELIDTIIISRDGTLGEIYEIQGIKIGLPQQPPKEEILNHNKTKRNQKWFREDLPEGLNNETQYQAKYEDYIVEQFRRREEGLWIYINGNPIWIVGTYWYGIHWVRELTEYSSFRVIQNELMIFWEACKADDRCFGMQYVKNRRIGASYLGIVELLESGTINEDKILGIISKKGKDSSKIFNRLIKGFKRLPCFFQPLWDGTTTPKRELILDVPTKKRAKNEVIRQDGLGSEISWHNTEINAMDGDAIFRSLLDECFGAGTKILMHDLTFKNIEDIRVGDYVIVEGGKKVKVAKTMRGYDDMYLISQPYSKDYIVSSKHRLYLEQRCKVNGIKDDGIKIMTPPEYLSLGKYKKRTTFGVRSKGIELPHQDLPIEPYIFGVWIGDGDSDCSRIIVNVEKDIEIGNEIEDYCLRNNFGLSKVKTGKNEVCKKYSILRNESDQNKNGKWCRNKFIDNLKSLNVYKNKNIPNIYLNSSREQRLELLAGLIDTDGSKSIKNNSYLYEIASSNLELANSYYFLCLSLGFKTKIKKRRSNLNTDYWNIYISGNIYEIPCRIERKKVPTNYERKYSHHINKIDVTPIGRNKYYGIQLEAYNDEDRRLILEDFTISMNCGKYPKEVPFDKYWYIVKTSHTKGIRITGKSMVVSTVNAKSKGGAEYETVWKDSDISQRNSNGQTKSGLYPLFIAAEYCLEGMFDEYGFTIIEDPEKPIMTDEGKETKIGSKTWLKNTAESLKNDPEKFNEHKRQFPDTIRDAFRDESNDCAFNLTKLIEQIDYNEFDLNENEYGNDLVERGNFSWVDGIQDGTVKWNPDPANGRFWIAKDWHPNSEMRNRKEKKMINGVLAFAPLNEHIGCFGVDPYNRSKTVDSRGSKGAIHLTTKFNPTEYPNDACILEYIDRPATVELFFEDVLMAMVYFSMPMLAELSNEKFLTMIKDRGYRHFSLNNPFKNYKDLNPTEREYGGVPPQDAKIGEQQYFAVESYIQEHIGISRDNSKRPEGQIGFMPFNRTLMQLKETDPNNRTKFDAYISLSLSLIGNKRRVREEVKSTPISLHDLYGSFDNSGIHSQRK